MDLLRWVGPLALALVSATAVDRLTEARKLAPPGFRWPWRRLAASLVVAGILWIGVFLSLGQIGLSPELDFTAVDPIQLFTLHGLFVAALLAWFLFAYAVPLPAGQKLTGVASAQLGFRAANPLKEIGIGLALGVLVWPLLLLVVGLVAAVLLMVGEGRLLPTEPPAMIVWVASLPVTLKLSIALSAGVVEEAFFRGFLQPRVGVALSTLFFVLAHLAYDQPFMLVGITLLSVFFAALVQWRQSIWAAIAAHFLFDAVQLLLVIPWALEQWNQQAEGLAPILGVGGL